MKKRIVGITDEMVSVRAEINEHLKHIVHAISPAQGVGHEITHKAIKYCLCVGEDGPKRIRPMLALWVVRALGNQVSQAHKRVACAIELLHIASLVHDDLPAIDNAGLRHGKIVLHKAFEGDMQCGEGVAIHVGFGLVCDAFRLLSNRQHLAGISGLKIVKIVHELSTVLGSTGVMLGQIGDLSTAGRDRALGELKNIRENKTGMFIRACVLVGCILGGATDKQERFLCAYGNLLGEIWQLRDDLLDVTSTPEQSGKSTQLDAENHQVTHASLCGVVATQAHIEELATMAVGYVERAKLKSPDTLVALVKWAATRTK